jgi:hypothetical protein
MMQPPGVVGPARRTCPSGGARNPDKAAACGAAGQAFLENLRALAGHRRRILVPAVHGAVGTRMP